MIRIIHPGSVRYIRKEQVLMLLHNKEDGYVNIVFIDRGVSTFQNVKEVRID